MWVGRCLLISVLVLVLVGGRHSRRCACLQEAEWIRAGVYMDRHRSTGEKLGGCLTSARESYKRNDA